MKHICLSVLLCLISTCLLADPITPKMARQLAKDFILDANVSSPLSVKHRAPVKGENRPYYIFSRGEDKGYVIVSGDDCLPTILGYTEEGNFDEDNLPPNLKSWLAHYETVIVEAQKQHAPARKEPRKAAGTKDIPVLLTTHWHQSAPYNNMCPIIPTTGRRAASGCVATAASQILYYWRKDLYNMTQYPTPTYDWCKAPVTEVVKRYTPLKWDLLKTSYSGNENKEYTDAVALLNYVVGTCCNMGYDEASGAYIADLIKPFEKQFGLSSKHVWKNKMTQERWEQIIYEDLLKSHPIEFAGYTVEWEGHAVVIDGYKSSTNLYHFNFGWGGQGDGYYTLDDVSGANGFGTEQNITYDIHPLNPNAKADIKVMNNQFISKMDNKIKVTVSNHSTLPLRNFYVFCLGGTNKPSSIDKANASNTTLMVNPGESGYFECVYKPTTSTKMTVYVTDENLAIIGTLKSVNNETVTSQLSLQKVSIDGAGEYEEYEINGKKEKVALIYDNSEVQAWATFRQSADGDACEPTVYGYIYKIGEDGNELKFTSSSSSAVFQPGQSSTISYKFSGLRKDVLYKVTIADMANSSQPIQKEGATDSICYFKLVGRDMAVTKVSDTELKLTGHYNSRYMATFTEDTRVTSYDVTELKGIRDDLTASNPNALFYATAEQGVSGRNIVADGVCDQLDLYTGNDFEAQLPFHATKATLHIERPIGKFSTIVLPFQANVPAGIFARRIEAIDGSYIRECESNSTEFLSCTPYMIINSGVGEICATEVEVTTQAESKAIPEMRGTFKTIWMPEGAYMLDDADVQYFSVAKDDYLKAFEACLMWDKKVRSTPTEYVSRDKKNLQLAQTIGMANDLIKQYAYESSITSISALQIAINEVIKDITVYPETDSLTQDVKSLQNAMEAFLGAIPKTDEEGNLDVTSWIKNPSFESGSTLSGWDKTSASASTITSEANYMSGADGTKVAYIKKGGNIEQVIEGVPNGEYKLVASVGADYDKYITVSANRGEVSTSGSDFGPFYLKEITISSFKVTEGTITLRAYADDDWAKVDNFRLYQIKVDEEDAIREVITDETTDKHNASLDNLQGTYDLSGRRVASPTRHGLYIQGGRKVIR